MGLISSSGYRPNVSFTLLNITSSNTTFIVRYRLVLLFERAFPLMTQKLHRVAQLRRVEGGNAHIKGGAIAPSSVTK
ncbi:hypothetical protein B6N13_09315 [Marinomonas sp. UCMA 3892]|nr:hypothetical protein [Marinomonas sp. UCMA 3892]